MTRAATRQTRAALGMRGLRRQFANAAKRAEFYAIGPSRRPSRAPKPIRAHSDGMKPPSAAGRGELSAKAAAHDIAGRRHKATQQAPNGGRALLPDGFPAVFRTIVREVGYLFGRSCHF